MQQKENKLLSLSTQIISFTLLANRLVGLCFRNVYQCMFVKMCSGVCACVWVHTGLFCLTFLFSWEGFLIVVGASFLFLYFVLVGGLGFFMSLGCCLVCLFVCRFVLFMFCDMFLFCVFLLCVNVVLFVFVLLFLVAFFLAGALF